jgi:nucleoside-diphosphate-sugar epimerase
MQNAVFAATSGRDNGQRAPDLLGRADLSIMHSLKRLAIIRRTLNDELQGEHDGGGEMTTFITGATTSLGRVLVRELVRQGEAVRLLVQTESNRFGLELPSVAFIRGEITDAVSVRKGVTGCDRICHLLEAPNGINDTALWRIQREGTRNVLQAAQDLHASSVVVVSSVAVLGPTRSEEASNETHESTNPLNLTWVKAQLAANEIAREYAAKGIPVKIVYPGVGYGFVRSPGNSGLAEQTLLRMATGKRAVIPGKGRNHLPVAYYKDTVQGITLAHERGRKGEGYLLVGDAPSWNELWQTVSDVLDKPAPTRNTPLFWAKLTNALPSNLLDLAGHDWHYDSEKARHELGWRPLSWHDGVVETWEEYQAVGFGAPSQRPVRAMKRA